MFESVRRFLSSSGLVKAATFSGIATIVKIITGFFINKIIAVFSGPSGLAIIGNFQNFLSMLNTASTGAIDSGIIKYTSEYQTNIDKKNSIVSSGVRIVIICSLILACVLIIFHVNISNVIIQTDQYANLLLLLGFTILLSAANTFFLSVLNGHKEIKKIISVNIISSCAGLILTLVLSYYYSIEGALYSLIINQSFIVFISLFFVVNTKWSSWKLFFSGANRESTTRLLKFSAMAITTAFTGPTSLLIVRNYIGNTVGWEEAGFWEGVSRISSVYLMLITSSISIYYLPRMSELKTNVEIRKELFMTYKIVLPIVFFMAAGIFLCKNFIIVLLFTDSFKPMRSLFTFQLIGDFLKIAAWLLSYLMVAKAMTKVYIATEIIFNATFVGLALLLIKMYGVIGVTYAYAVNYFLYGIAMAFIFRKVIYGKN
jgi:PST family polysaccharide transporter